MWEGSPLKFIKSVFGKDCLPEKVLEDAMEKQKKNSVYCRMCQHLMSGDNFYRCEATCTPKMVSIPGTPIDPPRMEERRGMAVCPYQKNKNNDCPDFKAKVVGKATDPDDEEYFGPGDLGD